MGFSLIEIVIVLAISGLIIMLVFLAFQQGARVQRDNRRKEALTDIASNLERFRETTDNDESKGFYPTAPTTTGYTPGLVCGRSMFSYFFKTAGAGNPSCGGAYAGKNGKYAIKDNQDPLAHQEYEYDPATLPTPTSAQPAGIHYDWGFACGVPGPYDKNSNPQFNSGVFRLTIKLESGSTYCIDNSQRSG